jgi:hypothetical protein
MLPRFHDAHAHAVQAQEGGFLIALEGTPVIPGTLDNAGVLAAERTDRLLFAVVYARHLEPDSGLPGPIIKYHPRREGFSPEWVANDIRRYERRLVLIDTLNAVRWQPRAYWDLAITFPTVEFVMCHAGGYDILEFVKMCRFLKNVWIDFSATQHTFGWVNGQRSPGFVGELIDHSLRERRIAERVMYGSDNPEFLQEDAVERTLEEAPDPDAILRSNFERLIAKMSP